MKSIKLGFLTDLIASKIGLRFICFSPFPNPPEDLEHMKSDKALLHNPDIFGNLRCAYCNRLKRFHLACKISKFML